MAFATRQYAGPPLAKEGLAQTVKDFLAHPIPTVVPQDGTYNPAMPVHHSLVGGVLPPAVAAHVVGHWNRVNGTVVKRK